MVCFSTFDERGITIAAPIMIWSIVTMIGAGLLVIERASAASVLTIEEARVCVTGHDLNRCLPVYIWESDFSFERGTGDGVVLGYCLVILQDRSPPWPLWLGTGLLWVITLERLAGAP